MTLAVEHDVKQQINLNLKIPLQRGLQGATASLNEIRESVFELLRTQVKTYGGGGGGGGATDVRPIYTQLSSWDINKYTSNTCTHTKNKKFKLHLAHRRTDANCIHLKDNAPKPLGLIIREL